jgi:hypothetical protein
VSVTVDIIENGGRQLFAEALALNSGYWIVEKHLSHAVEADGG